MTSERSLLYRQRPHVFKFKVLILLILLALLFWQWRAVTPEVATAPPAPAATAESPAPAANAPELTDPLAGAELMAGSLTLVGNGDPGSTVQIALNGTVVGQTRVNADGRWSFTTDALDAGRYEVGLATLDSAGNVAADAGPVGLTLLAPLAAPTLVLPPDGRAGEPMTLTGTGTPGSDIAIVIDGQLAGTTTAGADGRWAFDVTLPPGTYQIQAQARAAHDSVAAESAIATLTLAAPVVEIAALQLGDATLADLRPSGADGLVDGRLSLAGAGEPGKTIRLHIEGMELGTAVIDAAGNWTFDGEWSLAPGTYGLAVEMLDGDGTLLGEGATAVTVPQLTGALQVLFAASAAADSTSGVAAGGPVAELILDASWSMGMPLEQSTRIAGARQVLTDLVAGTIPEGMPVALRAFGNVAGNYACRTDLMVPLQPLDREAMTEVIAGIEPQFNANTPIASALALVASDLADSAGPKTVVLMTDGEETCGGNPGAAIETLADQGINVQVNIVGLAVADAALKAEFARWAEQGGGRYFDANNVAELTDALTEVLLVRYEVQQRDGTVVGAGVVGGEPVAVPAGDYLVTIQTSPTLDYEVSVPGGEVVALVAE